MPKGKIICQYCKNSFTTKSGLNKHQKNTKYCLKIRQDIDSKFKCTGCDLIYSSKRRLNEHKENCILYVNMKHQEEIKKIKLENIYNIDKIKIKHKIYTNELKEQVKDLQNKLEHIAVEATKRPITINNSTNNNNQKISQIINNLIPITKDYFDEQAQYLTMEHIKNGAEGYAQYAMDYPLKDRVVCTDFSRRKLKYKNEDGEVVADPEMVKLAQRLFTAIELRNTQLTRAYTDKLKNKMFGKSSVGGDEMTQEETDMLNTQTDLIIDRMTTLANQRIDITGVASGLKPDMYHSFVKNICSMSVK